MCLQMLSDFEVKTCYGYKIFVKRNNKLCSMFKGNKKSYTINTKVNEQFYRDFGSKTDTLSDNYFKRYSTGFHIFLNLKNAKNLLEKWENPQRVHAICRVRFSNIIARGLDGGRVVVTKNMTILKEVK